MSQGFPVVSVSLVLRDTATVCLAQDLPTQVLDAQIIFNCLCQSASSINYIRPKAYFREHDENVLRSELFS